MYRSNSCSEAASLALYKRTAATPQTQSTRDERSASEILQHKLPPTMKTAIVFAVVCVVAIALPANDEKRGGVDVDVHREKGVGTVVDAKASGTVWKSGDGNTRVDADGQYHRVHHGPGRSKPQYSGGVRVSHRW